MSQDQDDTLLKETLKVLKRSPNSTWELKHRALTSQCVTELTMFCEETRWPGYYYRGDHMKLDDDNWHCLTVSRSDPKTGKFSMEKVPVYHIVDENEKKKAS